MLGTMLMEVRAALASQCPPKAVSKRKSRVNATVQVGLLDTI